MSLSPSGNRNTSRQNHDESQQLEMDVLAEDQTHWGRGDDRMPLQPRSPPPQGIQTYVVGIALLLCVVLLWTASNFITQDLFEDGFNKPFFVTYTNTSAFVVYLLPFAIKKAYNFRQTVSSASRWHSETYQSLPTEEDDGEGVAKPVHDGESALPPLTLKETVELAAIFCVFWFIANWAINAALGLTSVASATILSSMSGFFTLGIGRLFRVEKLTTLKICTVFVSFLGVVLVSWSDTGKQPSVPLVTTVPLTSTAPPPSPRHPILGDALALISALFYAIYVILLKIRIKSESRIDMQTFFGFVGLFNILLMWPVGLILHATGIEPFELPNASRLWIPVLINMGITLSSDYLYVLAMLKTTPLVVTVGLSLTIPFAVVGDFMRGRTSETQVIIGAGLVVASFFILGVAGNKEEDDKVLSNTPDSEL